MTKPHTPDPLADAKLRFRIAVLVATQKALGAKSPYHLIEVIRDTFALTKRAKVTHAMDLIICRDTLAGRTAAQIGEALGISEPTVVSARRRLGLTHHRSPKVGDAAPQILAENP